MKRKNNNHIIVTDKTPSRFSCLVGTCPSIFEAQNDTYIIVGKKQQKKHLTEKVKNKIGKDEIAIEVPKGLIDDLNK